jgi:hypothetical protein
MVDSTTAIIAAVLAGVAGGFLNSWLTFNATGEPFNGRKHGNALIVGALTGMALGLGLVIANDVAEKGPIESGPFAVGLFATFLAAAGVDQYRSKASHLITNAADARAKAQAAKSPPSAPPSTTTTTTTATPPK